MKIVIKTKLTASEWNDLYNIHQDVFGDIARFKEKLTRPVTPVFTLAEEYGHVIGYKIGYPLDETRFYSWMGAVDARNRNRGIASNLMLAQHEWAQRQGYHSIETKTMNRWRQMLLLNIRHGFDVKAVTIDENGREKILLRKIFDQ